VVRFLAEAKSRPAVDRSPVRRPALKLDGLPSTFLTMSPGRGLRLLFLALTLVVGRAEGAEPHAGVWQAPTGPTISAPRESLPLPVHNEATCAFCQAAIFPPCAPVPPDMWVGEQGLVYRALPAADTRAPHATTHRTASSRAPPALRIG
jgi:hypothetical protein